MPDHRQRRQCRLHRGGYRSGKELLVPRSQEITDRATPGTGALATNKLTVIAIGGTSRLDRKLRPAEPGRWPSIPMDERSSAFLEETLRFWRAQGSTHYTAEDARQAIQNIAGFFQILSQWSVNAKRQVAGGNCEADKENQRDPV